MQVRDCAHCEAHCLVLAVRQAHAQALVPRVRTFTVPALVAVPLACPHRVRTASGAPSVAPVWGLCPAVRGVQGTWPHSATRVLPRAAAPRLVRKLSRVHLPCVVDAQLIEPRKLVGQRLAGLCVHPVGPWDPARGRCPVPGTRPELVDVDGSGLQKHAARLLRPPQGAHDGGQRAALVHQPHAHIQDGARSAQQQSAPGPRVLLRTAAAPGAAGRQRQRAPRLRACARQCVSPPAAAGGGRGAAWLCTPAGRGPPPSGASPRGARR